MRSQSTQDSGINTVLERNIEALLERRRREERERTHHERFADAVTRFAGSMAFVYLNLLLFSLWIALNSGLLPVRRFDPSLVLLAMLASVEAIFLTTFVLIAQNRMAAQEAKRAELHLQISLLAEHEVTHLIRLVSALGDRQGIREEVPAELGRHVEPEKVLEHIEQTLKEDK